MAKLFFEFLWTDTKWRSIKTNKQKKKTEREGEKGRERGGRERERDQYSTILTEPKVDRTEPKLLYSSYSNTKSVLVELSRQS